jgi:hypothetical protein
MSLVREENVGKSSYASKYQMTDWETILSDVKNNSGQFPYIYLQHSSRDQTCNRGDERYFAEKMITPLLAAISQNNRVTRLHVFIDKINNPVHIDRVSKAMLRFVQNVLPHQRSLQTFTMCLSNRMGIQFYDCMAQALVKNSSLDRLSLCATDEDDKTCFRALSAIARALKANNTLTSINISTLKFSRRAMGELVQGLNQNSHLKSLSLCHTNIDNALLSILAETMRNHRSITDLHLDCNPVNDIDPLCSSLRYNGTLRQLTLAGGPILKGSSVASLLNLLQQSVSIEEVKLYRPNINASARALISSELTANRSLKLLYSRCQSEKGLPLHLLAQVMERLARKPSFIFEFVKCHFISFPVDDPRSNSSSGPNKRLRVAEDSHSRKVPKV